MIKPLVLTINPRGISNDLLRFYAESLGSCMQAFPTDLQLSSNIPLDPVNLPPIAAFQNTCLLVYRQNLSPQCPQEQRLRAIDQCLNVACDTATFLNRCMHVQPQFADWKTRLSTSASTLLCTHIWRCALFTIHRGHHDASLTLIRTLAIIGDARDIVLHCGRHISFFLHQRLSRRDGSASPASLDADEDLLAYLSADLQSNGCAAWIWGDNIQQRSPGSPKRDGSYFPQTSSSPPTRPNHHLSVKERHDWGGWEYIERTIQTLQQQQQQQQQPRAQPRAPPPPHLSSQMQGQQQLQQQPRNRMDIAHIT
jgi:hypothetical protein